MLCDLYRDVRVFLAIPCLTSQGPEPEGDRASRRAEKVTEYGRSDKYYKITNRVNGPPLGEAPARSSLVPRDLTAESCLMPLATLGLSVYVGTPYGVLVDRCWVCSVSCLLPLCLV